MTAGHLGDVQAGVESTWVEAPVVSIDRGRVAYREGAAAVTLHPLWLRDRSLEAGAVDAVSRQRLYEPTDLPIDLRVTGVRVDGDSLLVSFSDGHRCDLDLPALRIACGLVGDPEEPPVPRPWRGGDAPQRTPLASLHDDEALRALLARFFRDGYVVVSETPTAPGTILDLAARFGRVSPTSFGTLFDVQTKPAADDLAYTPVALAPHVDQPYRTPGPGLQFLHALVNDAPGGHSTVADGLAAVEALRSADPDAYEVLCALPVEFRYDVGDDILVGTAPVIETWPDGTLRQLRFSARLDFPPATDPDVLDRWYRGRRWLADHLADPAHQVEFHLAAGDLFVVDNHRVLHGRTAFDPTRGHRHVQGCYIDPDGPRALWRTVTRRLETRRAVPGTVTP